MDVGSAMSLALNNWLFFATVILARKVASGEGFGSFRLRLNPEGLLLYAEGAAAAVGSWLLRGLFMVLTGHGTVALQHPGRSFWLALAWAAMGYLPVTLFEESLFRGYVQDRISAKWGMSVAILAQALLFGPMHAISWSGGNGLWIKVAMVTVFGLAFGTAARNGRSLMWGVGFHHWWNITESLIEGTLSPVQLVAAGGLTGTTFGAWVGFASAVVVLGLTRLRFSGRAVAVGNAVHVAANDSGLPFPVSGNPIEQALPAITEEVTAIVEPEPTA